MFDPRSSSFIKICITKSPLLVSLVIGRHFGLFYNFYLNIFMPYFYLIK